VRSEPGHGVAQEEDFTVQVRASGREHVGDGLDEGVGGFRDEFGELGR